MPITPIGLKLSEIPSTSSVNSTDLLLIEQDGFSRSVEIGVITSGLAAGISGDISGVISGVFDSIISGITSDITYISGAVDANTVDISALSAAIDINTSNISSIINVVNSNTSAIISNTSDINVISGLLSDVDSLSSAYDPVNYTQSTNTISGHYEGIDIALAVISGQITSGGGSLPSGITIENEIYDRVEITPTIITNGKFSISEVPKSPDNVRLWPQGGGLQINLSGAIGSETPDFEVVSAEIKINANSSPTSALSNSYIAGDILNIVYEMVVN
jgi:hypothetical protein